MPVDRSPRGPATPRDVLGVPVLPPGAVTVQANRVRAALGRLHAAMGPPPVQILEGMFGLLEHRVLTALCEADVPDALTGPTTVAVLADRVDGDPEVLERLLRFAASRGWVRFDRRGRVRPTAVTRFLTRAHPGGWRAWVDFAGGEEVVAAVGALSVRPVADPFAKAHGRPFFDWMAEHPDRWATFDEAMAAGARMHALGLAAALDWHTRRVCDVGGGTGTLLATLLDLVPHLEGTVLDLPAVAERAVTHPRLTAVGGDAFAAVPAGFDTYLFVNVLHDWDDERATALLARAAEAASGRSDVRIVVVDNDRPAIPQPDIAVATDVLMAALTPGGKERDAAAFAGVGRAAGLRLERSVRLPSADLAHVFVPG